MIELDKDNFAKSLRAFLQHMKEKDNGVRFTSFDHPFLVDNEIAYKLDAQAKARKILAFSKWPSWRSKRGRILRAMRDACDPSVSNNLLEHQYGESGGSYSALYRLIPDDIRAFEALALDLHAKIYEPDSVIAEAFDTRRSSRTGFLVRAGLVTSRTPIAWLGG